MKLLILNVNHSGMNPYLIGALKKEGLDMGILDLNINCPYRYLALFSSFKCNLNRWKENFDKKMGIYYKSPSTFLKRARYFDFRLKRYKESYDIIFQFSSMYSHYFGKPKKPYVVFIDWTRALSEREYSGWAPVKNKKKVQHWLFLEGELYRNASFVFTPSNYTRNSLMQDYGVSPEKVLAVGYGAPLDKIPSEGYKREYDGKTILFVGYDFERKGGFVLLKAFEKVRNTIPNARLLIVSQAKMKDKIEQAGCEFIDSRVPREEILKLYEWASIFCMPSLCEPFGLVLLEAMAYKLACVGTNIDAMPEIIEDGKTGFLVPPHNDVFLADKLCLALNDAVLLRNMGESGYARLKQSFTWERVGQNITQRLGTIGE